MTPRSLSLLLGAVTALCTLPALADGDPSTDELTRVIPYEGTIEVDGEGFTGSLGLRFTLFDADDNALWTETYSPSGDSGADEPVYAGTFSVLLGEYVPLEDAVLDATDLFVGVELSTDDFATSVELTGRQRIGMAPFAVWASAGADFDVAGNLTVDGHVLMGDGCLLFDGGPTSVCDDSGVTVRAAVNPADGAPIFRVASSGGLERLRVEHRGDVEINDHLLVRGPDSDTGGVGNVTATGDVNVGADLGVSGDATVDGDLTVTGTITNLVVSDPVELINTPADAFSEVTRLALIGDSMCFLTRFYSGGGSDDDDYIGCEVFEGAGANAGWWMLRAAAASSARLTCQARCLTW